MSTHISIEKLRITKLIDKIHNEKALEAFKHVLQKRRIHADIHLDGNGWCHIKFSGGNFPSNGNIEKLLHELAEHVSKIEEIWDNTYGMQVYTIEQLEEQK